MGRTFVTEKTYRLEWLTTVGFEYPAVWLQAIRCSQSTGCLHARCSSFITSIFCLAPPWCGRGRDRRAVSLRAAALLLHPTPKSVSWGSVSKMTRRCPLWSASSGGRSARALWGACRYRTPASLSCSLCLQRVRGRWERRAGEGASPSSQP